MSTTLPKTHDGAKPHKSSPALACEERDAGREIPFAGQPLWKRLLDLIGSSIGLIGLLPLFAVTATVIKLGSRGPIFFRQERVGAGGQSFKMWKFRTMSTGADQGEHFEYVRQQMEANGSLQKLNREDVLIPFGSLMRRLSIDEFPQLLNVWWGEMSLVGPRPDVVELTAYEPWQLRRFEVLPGMTGLWQVSGKNGTTFQQMMKLDVEYVDKLSFWIDIQILLRTPGVLLKQLFANAN